MLDLLKDFDNYVDDDMDMATKRLISYVKKLKLKRSEVDKYIDLYPERIYKIIYKMRLYDVFA